MYRKTSTFWYNKNTNERNKYLLWEESYLQNNLVLLLVFSSKVPLLQPETYTIRSIKYVNKILRRNLTSDRRLSLFGLRRFFFGVLFGLFVALNLSAMYLFGPTVFITSVTTLNKSILFRIFGKSVEPNVFRFAFRDTTFPSLRRIALTLFTIVALGIGFFGVINWRGFESSLIANDFTIDARRNSEVRFSFTGNKLFRFFADAVTFRLSFSADAGFIKLSTSFFAGTEGTFSSAFSSLADCTAKL